MNEEKERAIDMIRHIAAAQGLSPEGVAEVMRTNSERVKLMPQGAEDQTAAEPPKPKDAAALRVEMQNLITYTRERFEKCGGNGFHPECFSTLMMAYRSAIEMGSWGEDDD